MPPSAPDEAIRCVNCEALLTAATLPTGRCGQCRWQSRDVVVTPDGDLWQASWDRYAKRVEWTQLLPLGHHSDDAPDARAVLLARDVEGRRLPVTDLGTGDLFAVDVRRAAS